MPITALPIPPQPSDSPAIFNSRAFDLLGALPDFVTEANALEAENAAAATAAANAVLASKTTGPASSTDNTLPRFDGTTGKLLQGSGVVVSDANSLETNVGATYGGYRVKGAGSASNGLELALSSNGLTGNLWLYENAALRFATNNTERMTLDASGNLTLSAGTLGYGAGAGGTVTQVTSKATTVTLNKPSGRITMNGAALAGNAIVFFFVNNSFVADTDTIVLTEDTGFGTYALSTHQTAAGSFLIGVRNMTAGSLSEAVQINFAVIKGSTT